MTASLSPQPPAYCVFCGRLIIHDAFYDRCDRAQPSRLYCRRSCATRQQLAISRLRKTSPPEVFSGT